MGFFSKKVVWKDIKGYKGLYQVSNEGIVRSLNRKDNRGRQLQGKELSRSVGTNGYFRVNLYKNGVMATKQVHQLVAEAFCKKPKTKKPIEVHHKNKYDKLNNKASNLKWELVSVHRSEHAQGHTNSQGEKSGMAKLTEAKVREIKIRQKNYYRGQDTDLAREYGDSRETIRLIRKGKRWGHIEI